jgi:hypothetical protein
MGNPVKERFAHVELDTDSPDVDWDAYPVMLDAQALAEIFGVCRRLAYVWLDQYPGLVFKLGKLKRVPKAALQRCMAHPHLLEQYRSPTPQSNPDVPFLRLAR